MTRAVPQLYSVSEREYRNLLKLFKGFAIAGATATAVGLAGIVANQFITPESSETIRNLASYGLPTFVIGGFAMLYGGANYLANKSLEKKLDQ